MTQVTAETLESLKRLSDSSPPYVWKGMIEGRDHLAGSNFIMVGEGDARAGDIYLSNGSDPVPLAYIDLTAAARTYLPLLVDEILELRARLRAIHE